MSNPHIEDSSHWDAALEHYHCDRLEAAYAEIRDFGIGEAGGYLRWYRVIEAETITRQKSQRVDVNDWLKFEFVPLEVLDLREELANRIEKACDEVARRLGWIHSEQTLFSILAEETDAPWASHPYGYCVHKEPYAKICLPNYLVDDPEEFSQAVAHEYAHVISENLADGYCSRWLEEALSVLVEQRFDEETWRDFRDGISPWRQADDLELAIEGRTDDEEGRDEVWLAYQQAGWIGRYMASLGNEARLGRLLREVANESVAWNLRRTVRRQGRVEAALETVFGMSQRELFSNALAFLRDQPGP
ncbi:hypothetical protein [Fimbriimonas ginsengisoli]|uniref:Peptidase MA-like domain-containing protein n=1 Tax=Fimbriimonas ginsengisoli Gsoil 348 TaxID=661478 RepID=A0A068NWM2_FIMGI|nr:hypothetical protein [Fimbriimonas ginsengisoli]AIE87160.1 hypothetical protein OP10G_3792 [Fimbriimonas ginsengisoli Gsoil 348]